jgi:hypothetical protein
MLSRRRAEDARKSNLCLSKKGLATVVLPFTTPFAEIAFTRKALIHRNVKSDDETRVTVFELNTG